jgi:Tfp pilus assembly protein PilO
MTRRKTSRKRWAVDRNQFLILLVASVMAGSFFVLVLWPRQQELTALGSAVSRERQMVTQKIMTSHEGLMLTARIAGLRKAQDPLSRRLPTGPAEAELLQAIDREVAAEPTVDHAVERGDFRLDESAEAVPLKLSLSGPFDAVYRCLARIEGLERLSCLRSVSVSSKGADGQVAAEAELLAYYLPAEKGRGAPAARTTEPKPEKGRGL